MNRKVWPLAAISLVTLLTNEVVHATDLAASASTEVTFSYRLIDLDPDDGITPSVNFIANDPGNYRHSNFSMWSTHVSDTPDIVTHEVAGTVFDSTSDHAAAGYGNLTASKVANQVTTNATVTLDQLLDPLNVSGGVAMYSGSASFEGDDGSNDVDWKLSPNTALIIEGTYVANVDSHVAMLAGSTAANTVALGESLGLSGHSHVFFSLSADLGNWEYRHANYSKSLHSFGYLGANAGASREGAFTLNDSFELRLDNTTTNVIQGEIYQSMTSVIQMYNMPVPEASMVAMYAIGLPLLAGLTLRRRRRG